MVSSNNNAQFHIPRLPKKNYNIWCIQYTEPESTREEATMSNAERQTLRESRKKDNKALFMIYQGLDEATLEMVTPTKTLKEA
jgi:hypothetical protein